MIEAAVAKVWIEEGVAKGVILANGERLFSKTVVLTAGTYMTSNVLRGHTSIESGPENQPTINTLSASLEKEGVRLFRLKTGTPPRIKMATVDFLHAENNQALQRFIVFLRRQNQMRCSLFKNKKYAILFIQHQKRTRSFMNIFMIPLCIQDLSKG